MIDPERAKHAADLYNRACAMLEEHGWREIIEEDPFYQKGKPTGAWRHVRHAGSFSMDAAFITMAQSMPKRG